MDTMFVTFYDKKNKKPVAFMEEMAIVPCIGDNVYIDKVLYVVTGRIFVPEKKHKCCCYVSKAT